MKKRINDNNDIPLESREIDNELIVHKGEGKQRKRISTTLNSSPLISTLSRKLGVHQHKFPTFGRHLHHHLPSSSNSLLHHYVSSPKLSGNQQKQQKSPLLSNYKRQIFSVLPASISSSPSSPFNSTKCINSYNQIIRTSSVPPFKATSSSFPECNDNLSPLKSWPEGKEDVNDERRQRAIAQLLNEMERIRNIDNDDNEAVDGTVKLIIQSSSQQNSSLIKNQQNNQFLRAPPPPPPPPPPSQPPINIPQSSPPSQQQKQQNNYYSFKYPQNVGRQYKIGKVQQFSDEEEEEEEELGRIEGSGLGMPRQKK